MIEYEQGSTPVHYLVHNDADPSEPRPRGRKLHAFKGHVFVATHLRSGEACAQCGGPIRGLFGKNAYECCSTSALALRPRSAPSPYTDDAPRRADCNEVCHKSCYTKGTNWCRNAERFKFNVYDGAPASAAAAVRVRGPVCRY